MEFVESCKLINYPSESTIKRCKIALYPFRHNCYPDFAVISELSCYVVETSFWFASFMDNLDNIIKICF